MKTSKEITQSTKHARLQSSYRIQSINVGERQHVQCRGSPGYKLLRALSIDHRSQRQIILAYFQNLWPIICSSQ